MSEFVKWMNAIGVALLICGSLAFVVLLMVYFPILFLILPSTAVFIVIVIGTKYYLYEV